MGLNRTYAVNLILHIDGYKGEKFSENKTVYITNSGTASFSFNISGKSRTWAGGTAYYELNISEAGTSNSILSKVTTTASTSFELPKNLYITNQPYVPNNAAASTSKILLSYRAVGSTGPFSTISVPGLKNAAGADIPGSYAFDWSSIPGGNYEYQYVALSGTGTILNQQSGTFNTTTATAPTASA